MKHYDMHCHSLYSEDTDVSPEAMCASALAKGLAGIAFTEHVDFNPADKGFGYFDGKKCFSGLEKTRLEFDGRLTVLRGMEFSEPHLYPGEFAMESREDWDVIIGSVHMVDDLFAGDPAIRERYSLEKLLERYFSIMMDMAGAGGFDILGHLDFPKRYYGMSAMPGKLIDQVLERLVENRIAMEINTSPLRKGLNECCPSLSIVRRYAEMGGVMITLGSDAHQPEEVGAGLNGALEMVRQVPGLIPGYFVKRQFMEL